MDRDFLASLTELFERSSLSELDYSNGEIRLRLVKPDRQPGPDSMPPNGAELTMPKDVGRAAPNAQSTASLMHVVMAPCAGTFHRGPGPGNPPLVEVGDVVVEGDTLATVEAMKMFHTVVADQAGRIVAIVAEDGASVAIGAPLFTIETGADLAEVANR